MTRDAVRSVRGFRFGAVNASIKKGETLDVALAVADTDVPAAGVFTRNLVRAAPVEVARERLARGSGRAILVNSGCANACTGEAGTRAAIESTASVAQALGISADSVIPASTGVIGKLLPAERIAESASALVADLAPDGLERFSQAILTTDRFPKVVSAEIGGVRVVGVAKGAGMIHPDMATMLAFLFTDARVDSATLARVLSKTVAVSFNACSVDGDTSTNDCALLLASGASRVEPGETALAGALGEVCRELARMIVADGEGSNHSVEVRVIGLEDDTGAGAIARTIATSLLVKTALYGEDANWGRILGAAGRAGVAFNPRAARITVEGVDIVRDGVALGSEAEKAAGEKMKAERYSLEVSLGAGPGRASHFMCDLGHGYVDVNAGYRS